jgi:hypothetical protein
VVHLVRGANLLHAAGVHDNHPFRERHRLDLVVGDEERGRAQLAVQLLDLEPGLGAQLGVEVGERLVEQEHRRLTDDRTPHSDALPLSARELAGLSLQERRQLEDLRGLVDTVADLGFRHLRDLQAVGHVGEHRHVRIERVVLEHHGDVPLGRLEVVDHASGDRDLAAGDLLEPRHHAQQRRLAAARRADDDDELAVGDLGVDAVNDGVGLWPDAVALDYLSQRDGAHGTASMPLVRRITSRCRPGP